MLSRRLPPPCRHHCTGPHPQARWDSSHVRPVNGSAAAEIEDSEEIGAGRYFRDKYQGRSNDSVTFNVSMDTEQPAERSDWTGQWLVVGEASFTRHRSSGLVNYQKKTRRFGATVLAPAGERPRVEGFTLR